MMKNSLMSDTNVPENSQAVSPEAVPSTPPVASTGGQVASPAENSDIQNNKEVAGLAYMPLVCLFIFFFRKDSAFVQENAKQGSALFLLVIFGWILAAIPGIRIIGFAILLFSVIFIVLGFVKAFSEGVTVNIPVISNYTKKVDGNALRKNIADKMNKAMNAPVVSEEKTDATVNQETPQ